MYQPYIESATALSDYDERYKMCRFYRSLFCNFLCADGHWELILALKSAAPCRCMSK